MVNLIESYGLTQVDIRENSPLICAPPSLGLDEVRLDEARPEEVRPAEVRLEEVRLAEVRPGSSPG